MPEAAAAAGVAVVVDADHSGPGSSGSGSSGTDSSGSRLACFVARLLADSNCEDLAALDLRGLSQVTDYYVIATGTSERQLRSIADDVRKLARIEDQGAARPEGLESANWIVVDCFDVVVHLFAAEARAYYDLESMWADAPKVDWASATRPGQFASLDRVSATSTGAPDIDRPAAGS